MGLELYKEGHAGLSFLLFSPFMLFFKTLGIDLTYILITCFLMVGLSSLPDLDLDWEIRHRGVTHTFLAGIAFGILFAIVIGYAYGAMRWVMGFVSGFGGTASHLLGDVFNYSPLKPFSPFSDRKVAFGFFKSSNRSVNSTLLVSGLVAFVISIEPSIVVDLIGSIAGTIF